ncbi:response regulator transcription factor [Parvularcula mediterranea]|uniref:response regulator transcription factor n=1 Tax=Parvularcula mediterranea TaxID=2732508 RepID=UPI0018EA2CCF
MRKTVVLADDHQIVRDGLALALAKPGLVTPEGLEILAEAGDGFETLAAVKKHRPDLLVLDITMPLASGGEILNDIRRWSPETKIVIYSSVTQGGVLASLKEQGVEGMFYKGAPMAILYEKLPVILRGQTFIAPECQAAMDGASGPTRLTPREHQTLAMIVSGRTTKEIAELQGISPRTAEKHRASLMGKFGVKSAAALMAAAVKEGLIKEGD